MNYFIIYSKDASQITILLDSCFYCICKFFSFLLRYTNDEFKVFKTLSKKFKDSVDVKICEQKSNGLEIARNYINEKFKIPVVS